MRLARAALTAAWLLIALPAAGCAETVERDGLSKEAEAALSTFRSAVAGAQTNTSAAAPAGSVEGELARRVAVEQAGRGAMGAIWALPDPVQRRRAGTRAWAELHAIDRSNVAYLKSVLPPDGWFRHSRDGRTTAANAWLIAQHATDDPAFMQQVLSRMEALARAGEVKGQHFAMLFDRVALQQGRKQRYASQAICGPSSVWAFGPLEDAGRVDALRRAVGYRESFAETRDLLKIGQPC